MPLDSHVKMLLTTPFPGGESVFSELPAHRKIELMEVGGKIFS